MADFGTLVGEQFLVADLGILAQERHQVADLDRLALPRLSPAVMKFLSYGV